MEQTTEEVVENKDRVWVPLDELETWMRTISSSLMNMVHQIEMTIEKMNEDLELQKKNEGDDSNDKD